MRTVRRVLARVTAEAERAQSSRRVREVVDEPFDAVLHDLDVEVEQQADRQVGLV